MAKDTNKLINIGLRITPAQRAKLDEMAKALGLSVNGVIGLMIDNAAIEPVVKQEPVARIKGK